MRTFRVLMPESRAKTLESVSFFRVADNVVTFFDHHGNYMMTFSLFNVICWEEV